VLVSVTDSPEYQLAGPADDLRAAFSWADGEWEALRERLHAAGVRADEIPASATLTALADALRVAALHITEKELTARLDATARPSSSGSAGSSTASGAAPSTATPTPHSAASGST
jgi:hypothetical protein